MPGRGEGDVDHAEILAFHLFDFVERPLELDQHAFGAPDEDVPDRRQRHAELAALEQDDAQLLLQFLDAARHGRLRQPQVLGRRPQAASLHDGDYIPQMVELHDPECLPSAQTPSDA